MSSPKTMRLWLKHYGLRRNAPPRGWKAFLDVAQRENWLRDALKLYHQSWSWQQHINGRKHKQSQEPT